MSGFFILLIALVLIALFLVGIYNGFVSLKNKVDEAWSGISVQLKRRYDLIPNIVNTVKGYAAHEKETLERVINARNSAVSLQPGDVQGQAQANAAISQGIRQLFALAESYPDLKANTNFMSLQNSLTEIEDNLQNARRYYNATVRDYNTKCQSFPSVIIARAFNFATREFFELDSAEESRNVQVQF
ncbi:MAG: LemA family protein [Chitinophagales bacterium]|jgi:LemA protein|nr:LemA family protein [Chitinophagales bacterium]